MFTACTVPVPTPTLLELLDYLQNNGSGQDPAEIVGMAIQYWLDEMKRLAHSPSRPILHGYQWKELFLPEGTRLRLVYRADCAYAEVVGDKIIYQGHPVSPNQFATAFAGSVRNAWHDLTLRLPGEKNWKHASVRRRELKLEESPMALARQDSTSMLRH